MDKRIITSDMIREYEKWLIEEEKSPATIKKYSSDNISPIFGASILSTIWRPPFPIPIMAESLE